MATFRRSIAPGATYFFTVNTHRRQKLLTQPAYYQALKDALRDVKNTHPFTIDAFVLLPDHLHCIWTLPEHDADYSTRWNIIKRQVSQRTRELRLHPLNGSQLQRNELGLWQRRFSAIAPALLYLVHPCTRGNTKFAMTATSKNTSNTFTGIRSSMGTQKM